MGLLKSNKLLEFCITIALLCSSIGCAEGRSTNRFRIHSFGWRQPTSHCLGSTLPKSSCQTALGLIRGGSDEDSISENEESGSEEEEDDDSEVDEEDDEDTDDENKVVADSGSEIVEPYFMPPAMQLFTTFGCMMLSRRINLYNPWVIRFLRFAFVTQVLVQTLFIVYVRIMAKQRNDRSPVKVHNPISGLLQSQLSQHGDSGMVKNLASSFLSSETTSMEYDMNQAVSMQSGTIFNLLFMWFMHFKMEKIQPLLIQVVSGYIQLFYNPLFQVYVMGRNLERPFKTPANPAQRMMEAQAQNDSVDSAVNETEGGKDESSEAEDATDAEDADSDSDESEAE